LSFSNSFRPRYRRQAYRSSLRVRGR
jgi:hypothetical protein